MKLALPLFLSLFLINLNACQRDSSSTQLTTSDFAITTLQTNYETTPLAIETPNPLFSWQMQATQGTHKQSAYKLIVKNGEGKEVWNSGKTDTPYSTAVKYKGKSLQPLSQYQWELTVWNTQGHSATNSASFETGFMNPKKEAWTGAEWIGGSKNDLVFESNYLSVFRLNVDIQLDKNSQSNRAAFLLGGNDFRLQNKNLNLQKVENGKNESFVAFELDTRGLDEKKNQAHLNIYRVGYTPEDSIEEPFAVLPIPSEIVNTENRFKVHRIYIDAAFGIFNIYINAETDSNRLTEHNPKLPYFIFQGLNVNPSGRGGNFISYPILGDVGFWVDKKQKAQFSNIDIKNWRAPSNTIFAAASEKADVFPDIFSSSSNRLRTLSNGHYEIGSEIEETIVLADPSNTGTPMLRHVFELENKKVKHARLYSTARGVYEIYINGSRIDDDYFAPGLSQYNKHHNYQVYDVTANLNQGKNAIGALLGEGWWSGNISFTPTNWNYFGDRQSLLTKLIITFDDGTQKEITSNSKDWKVSHDGPIRYGSFFQGEIYDAKRNKDIEGWTTTLADSAFIGDPAKDNKNQLITSYDDMKLISHVGNRPEIVKALTAQSVKEVRPGVFIYDMGQNMVGVPKITLKNIKADANTPVILRYSEVLYPDLPEYSGNEGTAMIENLRAALVHDIYYPKDGDQIIQPRFTFHGYRYLEISGLEKALPLESVEGLVISSVKELSAHYESSNPLINKLWENITWSLRSNFLSIPTDTPARNERLGWSGDLNVFASTANYMTHSNAFMTRHMMAMRDLQSKEGRFPDVAPIGGGFGGTMWGSAGVNVAWETYRQYGDTTMLGDHYDSMVAYVDYLQTKNDPETGLLVEGYLSDWLSPENSKNDPSLLWEAYRIHALNIVAKASSVLDMTENEEKYREQYNQRKRFFNENYVDATTGKTIASGVVSQIGRPIQINTALRGKIVDTQVSYAVPLAFGVFDESNIDRAQKNLIELVTRESIDDEGETRPAHSLMTGFIGTASLLPALSQAGANDHAYEMLQQTSYPSLLYPVVNGATSIWERLNSYTVEKGFGGNNSMNSFNHYAFGAVGSWMMSYGRIESSWEIDGEETQYRFVVPANTQATLELLATDESKVVYQGESAEYIKTENGLSIYMLEPGDHHFKVMQ